MPPKAFNPEREPIDLVARDASVQDCLRTIKKLLKEIPVVLKENKSVTSEGRLRVMDLAAISADALDVLAKGIDRLDDTIHESSVREETVRDHLAEDVRKDVRRVVREEFAVLREEFVQRLPASGASASYASVAASGAGRKPSVKTPVTRPALVLKSSDPESKSSKDVVKEFKTSVSFKDVPFGPARVQPISNGCVRVEFDSVQQRDQTLGRLDSVKTLRAEPARRLRPLVIIKGISKDVPESDVVKLVRTQNPRVQASEEDVRVRFVRKNRKDDLFNCVLEVSPDVRVRLLELGRVSIDHQRVHVSDFSQLVQCFKCLGFGHTRPKCTSDVQRCSHCASAGHDFASCPDKADASKQKCHNCSSSGRSDVRHSATSSKHCEMIKRMEKRLTSRTDYGTTSTA